MSLVQHKQHWEELGGVDPFWAVLSHPERRNGRWDVQEFFALGEAEIQAMSSHAQTLGYPQQYQRALDFGCGVGRLSRALASRYTHVTGLDISQSMLRMARQLNSDLPNCDFVLNADTHLALFASNSFDLIYTNIVLQHLPHRAMIRAYVQAFLRILRPEGLLVFQLPYYINPRHMLQPRRRIYQLLRRFGIDAHMLHTRFGLSPISVTFVPERNIKKVVHKGGGCLLDIVPDTCAGPQAQSQTYYVTKYVR